jgi:uncharacterized membrane protein
MHTLLDVLHVVAAVFLIGPLAILPMSAMRALRAGQGPAVASLARSTTIFGWASLAVVVFGFGVLGTTDKKYGLSFGTPWIWISLVLYLIALGLTLFAVVPAMRAAVGGEGGAPASSGAYRRVAMTSGIASLLLVVVVVLMVAKP